MYGMNKIAKPTNTLCTKVTSDMHFSFRQAFDQFEWNFVFESLHLGCAHMRHIRFGREVG
jgi:hypothetical protein